MLRVRETITAELLTPAVAQGRGVHHLDSSVARRNTSDPQGHTRVQRPTRRTASPPSSVPLNRTGARVNLPKGQAFALLEGATL